MFFPQCSFSELQSTNWPNVNDITDTDGEHQDSPCKIVSVTSDPPTSTTETTTPTTPTHSPDLDTVRDPPPPDVLHPLVRPGLPNNGLAFPYYPVNGGLSAYGQGGAAGGGQLPPHSQSEGRGIPPAPKWSFHTQGGAGLPLGWFPQGVPYYGGLDPGHPLWAHSWSLVLRERSSEEYSD